MAFLNTSSVDSRIYFRIYFIDWAIWKPKPKPGEIGELNNLTTLRTTGFLDRNLNPRKAAELARPDEDTRSNLVRLTVAENSFATEKKPLRISRIDVAMHLEVALSEYRPLKDEPIIV